METYSLSCGYRILCILFFFCFLCFYLPIELFNSLETEIRLGPEQTLRTEKTLVTLLPPHLIQNKNDVIQTKKKIRKVGKFQYFLYLFWKVLFVNPPCLKPPIFDALNKCLDGLLSNPNLFEDKNKY